MAKSHGKQVKDDELYEELRKQGHSKEKSARIANAKAAGDKPSKKGGKAPPYEKGSKSDLYDRAKEIGIDGRSGMTKSELVSALRDH